jgi:hypothetical protein
MQHEWFSMRQSVFVFYESNDKPVGWPSFITFFVFWRRKTVFGIA